MSRGNIVRNRQGCSRWAQEIMRRASRTVLFLVVLFLIWGVRPAKAEDVAHRAETIARHLQQEAMVAVAGAQERIRGAEQTLEEMRAVEKEVRNSGEAAAMAIAHKAVAEAERGVCEARQLVEWANALLARREKQLDAAVHLLAISEKHKGGLRGMALTLDGEVQIFDAHGKPANETFRPLQVGDRIVTGKDGGSVRLILAGGEAEALLEPGSTITITADDLDAGFLGDLATGQIRIRAQLYHRIGSRFEVRTPTAAVAVRGTEFSVLATEEGTLVGVTKGVVRVTPNAAGSEAIEIKAGEEREWSRTVGWGTVRPADTRPVHDKWGD